MADLLLRHVRIVQPGRGIATGDVLVRAGRIAATGEVSSTAASGAEEIDGRGRLLTPGLIDVHTHGVMHSLYDGGPDSLRTAARELGRFGVTSVLPTIVPQIRDGWLERLAELAAAIPSVQGVHVPGLHLEGPFMAIGGAACPTLPGDLALLEKILAACAGTAPPRNGPFTATSAAASRSSIGPGPSSARRAVARVRARRWSTASRNSASFEAKCR